MNVQDIDFTKVPELGGFIRGRRREHSGRAARNAVERHVLVDPDVRREAKHSFRNDVLADLLCSSSHAITRRQEKPLLDLE
jgi:hypothetical protein